MSSLCALAHLFSSFARRSLRQLHSINLPLGYTNRRRDPKPEKRAIDKLSLARQAWSCGRARGGRAVAKKGHTEEQILRALRQAEGGTRVADIAANTGSAKPRSTFGRRSIRDWA